MAGMRRLAVSRPQAEALAEAYAGEWQVVGRQERVEEEPPPRPYTTAALLADAAERLGWSAGRTMRAAQALFEAGFITYPRTDSSRIAPSAAERIRRAAAERYGAQALAPHPPSRQAGEPFRQDGHEAIRPTDPARSPAQVPAGETRQLYDLVWRRSLAAFLRPARLRVVTLTLEKR